MERTLTGPSVFDRLVQREAAISGRIARLRLDAAIDHDVLSEIGSSRPLSKSFRTHLLGSPIIGVPLGLAMIVTGVRIHTPDVQAFENKDRTEDSAPTVEGDNQEGPVEEIQQEDEQIVEPAQEETISEPPIPETTPEPAPSVIWNIDSGVPDSDRKIVINGVNGLKRYLVNTYNLELSRTLFVNVRSVVPQDGSFQTTVRGDQLILDTLNPEWAMSSDKIREKILRHETYHFYQALTMNTLDTLSPGPTWLGEGSAEYVAFRSMANDGLFNYNEARALLIWNLYFGTTLPTLNLLESQQQWMSTRGPIYSEAALAVERLVATRGDASLNTYFQLLGQGVLWQEAFQQSFGITPYTFYQQFEQWRIKLSKPTGNAPKL